MIFVFSEHITDRLRYVLDFCFDEKGEKYSIITDAEIWGKSKGKKLNYSAHEMNADMQVFPQGILFESGLHADKNLTLKENQLYLDGVSDDLGILFYVLTRFEEYFQVNRDQHDRFQSKESVLVKLGINRTPVVDQIVKKIWEKLRLDYQPVRQRYNCLPSFDIDVAWAYKNRSLLRGAGALLKGKQPLERMQVLAGVKKDPYDTYDDIRTIAKQAGQVVNFILLGDWGPYDKNIHWKNPDYQTLIKELDRVGKIGIHPSYASYLSTEKVKKEKERLAEITGHSIVKSRQHFLRLTFPETYETLLAAGIEEDYSMGYANQIGFRAGTAFPHRFFNLKTNAISGLRIYPFAYMDSGFKDYLKQSPEEANRIISNLVQQVRDVGGNFTFIWHNSSIHDKGEWRGWKKVLEHTLKIGL